MIISLIAAVAQNRVIGRDNQLPWQLPDDMKHFKTITLYHHVLMGRKSYDSLSQNFKPLPHRTNIVVTRQAPPKNCPYLVASSPEAGIQLAEQSQEKELFVIGGAQLYRHILPLSQRMYLTEINAEVDGNIYFPEFDRTEWVEVSREHHSVDTKHALPFDFVEYKRQK